MIYLIGGVARSGKSSIRKNLLESHRISGIDTDSLRTLFELALPDLGIHYENPPMMNADKMAPFIEAFVRARLFLEEDFVIEGDCILPRTVAEFRDHPDIKMVFIGYPSIPPTDKVRQLSQEREGWTAGMNDAELARKVEQFVADSAIFKQQCAENGLPFIDASSIDLEATTAEALRVFGL